MYITSTFWNIIGVGLAIPSTLIIIVNLVVTLTQPVENNSYRLDLKRLGALYTVTLIGWAILFGIGGK